MDAYGTQRNPKSLKSFIARQPYKNLLLHLLHLPPYSPPWSAKLKLSALKNQRKKSFLKAILFFPNNKRILLLVLIAVMLPDAKAELVYDCTSQKNAVHAFSLNEVKPCPDFKTMYDNKTDQRVQIIS